MRVKPLIVLAPIIVLGAIVWLSFWLGSKAGAAKESLRRQGVDPRWAKSMESFVRECVYPTADMAAIEDMVVLPDKMRQAGQKLLAEAPGAAERRIERRRRGY